MLAAMLFGWRARFVMLAMTTLPLAAWLLTRRRLDFPSVVFPVVEYRSLVMLNAVSVGSLTIFFGWLLAGIAHQREARS